MNHVVTTHFTEVIVAISGNDLCDVIWNAVRLLKLIGLHVVVVVADGISNNRKFFKLNKVQEQMKGGVVFKVKNIYDPTRYVLQIDALVYNY